MLKFKKPVVPVLNLKGYSYDRRETKKSSGGFRPMKTMVKGAHQGSATSVASYSPNKSKRRGTIVTS